MTPSMTSLARRSLSLILRSLTELTQARAAELADVDPTALSRMGSPKDKGDDTRSDWERMTAILAACNLQVLPGTVVAIDPDELRALRVLAARRAQDAEGMPSQFGSL